jgi:2-keto-4-pentenoate hydratase/2-oxohepta-3-ene-1,7-dioic acid hydratase in catechol pathway
MKLATYYKNGPRLGIVAGDRIWDLREIFGLHLFESERNPRYREIAESLVPDDMALFIRINHGRTDGFAEAVKFAEANVQALTHAASRLSDVRLLPPVFAPSKIICCGNSYGKYLREWGLPKNEWPQDVKISFLKPPTALIGHGDTIFFPPDSNQWDYENELTVVIGRTCSGITPDQAHDYIFGYSILNDACVRDIPSWSGRYDSPRGKAGDTFAPFGPWVVAKEAVGDPNNLRIRTTVDGELRQDDRTSGLLWPVERIVAFVSRYIKLVPGDIVTTGSTSGNALVTGKWLRPGQVVRCEIEGIGVLENTVGVKKWSSDFPPLPSAA